ncbi:retinoblastoma family protein-like isoform X1 [Anopheles arabiensis]|uniref:retinoblastoma family protein-like isoform X1 n=1 Tax=Anopheles arabiensis TaxID=7173 RepID=UPI001AAD69E5|nr:retinoblastoma family protein-like isoform X1 [Anopheles arabiensis]
MASNDNSDLRETHRKICRELNIDADTENRSWSSFERTRDQFDLTGEPTHWMCCALYVACLQELPAVGDPDHYIQGNGVNITNLLTQCDIKIQEFFSKMKQWSEIRSLPGRLRTAVDNLHHEFSVSITTYTVFGEDFPRIFNEANIVPDEPKRNKKSKPNPCSYNRLREFSWLLFLTVKEQHREQRRDLATAMDLCVCVMDLIYRNVVADGRMDLVNPKVLHEGGSSSVDGTTAAAEAALKINVREQLCNEYPTTSESVDETNRSVFLPALSSMVEANDLRGTPDGQSFLGLVSVANFEDNLKLLNRRYERCILRCGMLDERIALSSRSSPTSQRNRWSVNVAGPPRTPLSLKSGRTGGGGGVGMVRGIRVGFANGGPEQSSGSPFVVRGTLSQLMKRIRGHEPGSPRGTFMTLMKNCTPSPLGTVLEHVDRMRARFVKRLTEQEGWKLALADCRFDAVEALYYQLLENIIPWELKKRPSMTVSRVIYDLCSNAFFNETVIVCAAEIIFFLRQEQHNFPWILEVFGMEPFRFFHIIEVTVTANNDILTSDIVNHLRRIEEQLVDSISWKSSSVLWECMEKENYQIPANKDVEQRAEIAGVTPLKGDSVPNTPNGTRGGGPSTSTATTAATTTTATTATGRPVPHPDSAKKKLFVDLPATPTKLPPPPAASTSSATPSAATATSTSTGTTVATAAGSATSASSSEMANVPGNGTNGSSDSKSISSFSSPQRSAHDPQHPPSNETRRLNFFFRKMYQVAYDRLCNLCQNLGIDSEVILKLIWTILEFTITKCSQELMRDRHLDQLLMCAIFVTMRIKKLPNTFKQIMHCYHSQPQANSSIYRSVFIRYESAAAPPDGSGKEVEEEAKDADECSNGQGKNGTTITTTTTTASSNGEATGDASERCPVTEMAGTSVQYGREVYGDIIKFYNDIYVVTVHHFALQYYNADVSQESLFLSPTPKSQMRNIQKSPRQISSGINLYVSTTNKISSLKDSPNVRVLTFPSSPGQSPTMHERKLPLLVRGKVGETAARRLTEPAAYEQSRAPKLRRLDKIHQERQHQDNEMSENE